MAGANIRIKMTELQNPVTGDSSGLTGFLEQFQV